MNIRLSRVATGLLLLAAMALLPSLCWGIYYELGPSKDEWGLKYDVTVSDADADNATVVFTLASEGRLKSIYSATVIASTEPDRQGFQSFLVNAPIEFKPTRDGKRVGQVQVRKEFLERCNIRILTLNVDGKRYASAQYYNIPVRKFLSKSSTAAVPSASSLDAKR